MPDISFDATTHTVYESFEHVPAAASNKKLKGKAILDTMFPPADPAVRSQLVNAVRILPVGDGGGFFVCVLAKASSSKGATAEAAAETTAETAADSSRNDKEVPSKQAENKHATADARKLGSGAMQLLLTPLSTELRDQICQFWDIDPDSEVCKVMSTDRGGNVVVGSKPMETLVTKKFSRTKINFLECGQMLFASTQLPESSAGATTDSNTGMLVPYQEAADLLANYAQRRVLRISSVVEQRALLHEGVLHIDSLKQAEADGKVTGLEGGHLELGGIVVRLDIPNAVDAHICLSAVLRSNKIEVVTSATLRNALSIIHTKLVE